jgi:hypothetical protein
MNARSFHLASSLFTIAMVMLSALLLLLTIWVGIGGEIMGRIWGTIWTLFGCSLVISLLAREVVKLNTRKDRG